jgi:hypothetical protein
MCKEWRVLGAFFMPALMRPALVEVGDSVSCPRATRTIRPIGAKALPISSVRLVLVKSELRLWGTNAAYRPLRSRAFAHRV